MLPQSINTYFNDRFVIEQSTPVSGGCINQCFKLETSEGLFFLKINDAKLFPGMFAAEAWGLNLLASTNTIKIPKVFEAGETKGISFLLMEFIETGFAKGTSMPDFGRKLAALHLNTAGRFGLDHNNYIGSLPQHNDAKKSWTEFFIEMRLQPQIKIARDKSLLTADVIQDFEKLFKSLTSMFPNEKPALLHGDLWNGNYLMDPAGTACLVDPAVYYGHREMDISMTMAFGAFDTGFYEGYNEVFPLADKWKDRVNLCNLYPILVHVNLFGAGYVSRLSYLLKQYV